jgi:hypothetical protein
MRLFLHTVASTESVRRSAPPCRRSMIAHADGTHGPLVGDALARAALISETALPAALVGTEYKSTSPLQRVSRTPQSAHTVPHRWHRVRGAASISTLAITGLLVTHSDVALAQRTPASVRATIMASNVALGAAIGAVRSRISKRGVAHGVLSGAVGGAVTSAGRQLTASGRSAAGLVGRLVHGIGLGIGSLAAHDTLEFPLSIGPVTLRWQPTVREGLRAQVNATQLAALAISLSGPNRRLLWSESLTSGAFVVESPTRSNRSSGPAPSAVPGTIRLPARSVDISTTERRRDLGHEGIHVLQFDAMHEWLGRDLERRVTRDVPNMRWLRTGVDIGVIGPLIGVTTGRLWRYERNPVEREAWWLANGIAPLSPRR